MALQRDISKEQWNLNLRLKGKEIPISLPTTKLKILEITLKRK